MFWAEIRKINIRIFIWKLSVFGGELNGKVVLREGSSSNYFNCDYWSWTPVYSSLTFFSVLRGPVGFRANMQHRNNFISKPPRRCMKRRLRKVVTTLCVLKVTLQQQWNLTRFFMHKHLPDPEEVFWTWDRVFSNILRGTRQKLIQWNKPFNVYVRFSCFFVWFHLKITPKSPINHEVVYLVRCLQWRHSVKNYTDSDIYKS